MGICDPNTLSLLAQFQICSCQQLLHALVQGTAIHNFGADFVEECRDALILASSRLLSSWFGDPGLLAGLCVQVVNRHGHSSDCCYTAGFYYVNYHRIMASFGLEESFEGHLV